MKKIAKAVKKAAKQIISASVPVNDAHLTQRIKHLEGERDELRSVLEYVLGIMRSDARVEEALKKLQ